MVATDTGLGKIPSLPAQIEAVYNDGTTGLVDVSWEPITVDMVSREGAFTVNGTVEGTSVQAKAFCRVVDGFKPILREVKLIFDNKVIRKNEPIVGTLVGILNSGEQADLSSADVQYMFTDSRLEAVPGSNTIVLKEDLNRAFLSTVKAKVTLDGVTLETNQETITALGGNIASIANVSVISVRYNDNRYAGIKAIDGDRTTSWASAPSDNTKGPWIRLDFETPITIGKVNLVDRGHKINEIGEGLLEWEGGSMKVENIKWDGKPDNFVTFDQPIVTSWIKFTIDPDNKFSNSSPSEQGEPGLTEFEVFEAEEEFVKAIIDYKPIAVDTTIGTIPTLPAQVEAVYNDGTIEPVNVVWDEITADMVANEGMFLVSGIVDGTALKAKASVRVIEVSMPPVTTDNAPIGWVNQDTIVTLNAVAGSAEVAETYFIVDDGEQQMGNSVVLSEEGVHKLVYWSVDKKGNVEQAHTVTVSIDKTAPEVEVSVPEENKIYEDSGDLTVQYILADVLSGVDNSKTTVTLDGNPYQTDATTPLYTLPLGQHTLVVSTTDLAGNQGSMTVSFQTVASVESLKVLVSIFANNNWIDNHGIANSLQAKLNNNNLKSFVNEVQAQSGKHISSEAAEYLLRDVEYVLSQK